jgi:membrane-bound lytic murein transglycosylase
MENFTEVESLYDMDDALEGEMLVWAEGTVDQFIQDVSGNAEIQAVFDEYRYYFGEE